MLRIEKNKFLVRDYGKYRSGLVFVLNGNEKAGSYLEEKDNFWSLVERLKFYPQEGIETSIKFYTNKWYGQLFDQAKIKDMVNKMNIEIDGLVDYIIKGKYRKNKKGTKIFDTTQKGDYLVVINWGGSFNKSNGYPRPEDVEKEFTYWEYARSNGGGRGYSYFIVHEDYVHEVHEDEL